MKLMSLVPVETNNKDPSIQLIHKCQLQHKADEVELLILGNELRNRIKRWIIYKCILSQQHPYAKNGIKSTAGINNEINRHITTYRYIIYPFSEFRNVWEMFMAILMLLSLIFLPYIIAFYFNEQNKWFEFLLVVNIFYIFDTVLCFFTGYFDTSSRLVILERKLIIKAYLKTFFIVDLISALPVQTIFIMITAYQEFKWYWTVFSLLKIVRIRNLVVYCRNIRQRYQISFQTYKILEMSMILILCIHWATCMELYVPLVGRKINWQISNHSLWFHTESTINTTLKMYILCMNRATISLVSSSHFHDMKTSEDLLLNIFLTVLGRIGFIYILAQFLMLMSTFHSTKKKIVKSLQQLQEYMVHKELPNSVQQRILIYYNFWSNKSYKRDKHIISNVSPNLRQELLLHSCAKLLANVEFFKHLSQPIISQIVVLLKAEIYLASDVLVTAGTIGDALYYIVSGTVAVYSDRGDKICHLSDGSYFGEIALVMENEKRLSTIIAIETCEVYVLNRTDFMKIISGYPYLMSQLQKLSIQKWERPIPFETVYKCEGSLSTNIIIYKSDNAKE